LPHNYTRDMLLELLDSKGFNGKYDFVYVPYKFKNKTNLGWARVNMVTHPDARAVMRGLTGFAAWKVPSKNVLSVAWNSPFQGLTANVQFCMDNAVMHPDVPEQIKPLLFENGCRISLPLPKL